METFDKISNRVKVVDSIHVCAVNECRSEQANAATFIYLVHLGYVEGIARDVAVVDDLHAVERVHLRAHVVPFLAHRNNTKRSWWRSRGRRDVKCVPFCSTSMPGRGIGIIPLPCCVPFLIRIYSYVVRMYDIMLTSTTYIL